MSTISNYVRQNYTPVQACTVTSANPGVAALRRWSPQPNPPIPGVTPGSDTNNMQAAFNLLDSFGLPIPTTAIAPNFSGNVSGIQIPNIATYQVSYTDGWIVLPVGVTTVTLGVRYIGNCSVGIYVGKAQRYAVRVMWSNILVNGGVVNMTPFLELCGQKVAFIRIMLVNGYFNGGTYLQWNVGAGLVDVPTAAVHGSQPFLRKYPS